MFACLFIFLVAVAAFPVPNPSSPADDDRVKSNTAFEEEASFVRRHDHENSWDRQYLPHDLYARSVSALIEEKSQPVLIVSDQLSQSKKDPARRIGFGKRDEASVMLDHGAMTAVVDWGNRDPAPIERSRRKRDPIVRQAGPSFKRAITEDLNGGARWVRKRTICGPASTHQARCVPVNDIYDDEASNTAGPRDVGDGGIVRRHPVFRPKLPPMFGRLRTGKRGEISLMLDHGTTTATRDDGKAMNERNLQSAGLSEINGESSRNTESNSPKFRRKTAQRAIDYTRLDVDKRDGQFGEHSGNRIYPERDMGQTDAASSSSDTEGAKRKQKRTPVQRAPGDVRDTMSGGYQWIWPRDLIRGAQRDSETQNAIARDEESESQALGLDAESVITRRHPNLNVKVNPLPDNHSSGRYLGGAT